MRKWYFFFRVGGYLGGLLGVFLFVAGRRAADTNSLLVAIGAISIITGFISFFCSYALYLLARFRRR